MVGVEKARLEGSEAEARWGGVLGRWRAGMLSVGDGGAGGQGGRPFASPASILRAGPRILWLDLGRRPDHPCLGSWPGLILPAPGLSPCLCRRF